MKINEAITKMFEGVEDKQYGTYIGLFQDGALYLEITEKKVKMEIFDSEENFLRDITVNNPCKSRIIDGNLFK